MQLHVCLVEISEIMPVYPTPSNIGLSTNKTANTFPQPPQSAGYLSVTECTQKATVNILLSRLYQGIATLWGLINRHVICIQTCVGFGTARLLHASIESTKRESDFLSWSKSRFRMYFLWHGSPGLLQQYATGKERKTFLRPTRAKQIFSTLPWGHKILFTHMPMPE